MRLCLDISNIKTTDIKSHYPSGSDGTNVVRAFQEAVNRAIAYKEGNNRDLMDDIIELLRDTADEKDGARVVKAPSANTDLAS